MVKLGVPILVMVISAFLGIIVFNANTQADKNTDKIIEVGKIAIGNTKSIEYIGEEFKGFRAEQRIINSKVVDKLDDIQKAVLER